jgi:L-fuconolactonase
MSTSTLLDLGITHAIDTHVHPWRLDDLPPVIQGARSVRPDLAQDYSPERVVSTTQASGFDGVIFVQARDPHEDSVAEARFFIAAARELPQVKGCVIGIDLLDPQGTDAMLRALGESPVVRSCRMIKPENTGVGILSDERTKDTCKLLGERGLRLDLLIRSSNQGQLEEGVRLVKWLAENTETVVVGDHLLKPTGIDQGKPSSEWLSALRELSAYENFYVKLSGFPGEVSPGTDTALFWPFFDAAFEIFGPTRLMFGSDHPVSYDHAKSVSAVIDWLAARGLTNSATPAAIFRDTARQAYAL